MQDMSLSDIYTHHHGSNRDRGFSIMEQERGDFLKKTIGRGKEILDIGCRNGVLTAHFKEGNDVTGVDIDPVALEEAGRKLHIKTMQMDLLGDWREISEKKYDVIVAGEVLEHLYFPEKVLEKIIKHLKGEGMFIGSVPNAFSIKNRLRLAMGRKKGTSLYDPTHINHFSFDELFNLLSRHFRQVDLIGLGRYKRLSKLSPKNFAFDLVWVCKR